MKHRSRNLGWHRSDGIGHEQNVGKWLGPDVRPRERFLEAVLEMVALIGRIVALSSQARKGENCKKVGEMKKEGDDV